MVFGDMETEVETHSSEQYNKTSSHSDSIYSDRPYFTRQRICYFCQKQNTLSQSYSQTYCFFTTEAGTAAPKGHGEGDD